MTLMTKIAFSFSLFFLLVTSYGFLLSGLRSPQTLEACSFRRAPLFISAAESQTMTMPTTRATKCSNGAIRAMETSMESETFGSPLTLAGMCFSNRRFSVSPPLLLSPRLYICCWSSVWHCISITKLYRLSS